MGYSLDELKRERAAIFSKLFIVRCAICLLTVLLIVLFVFNEPITGALMVFLIIAVPAALFCYDELTALIASGKS